MTWLRGFTLLEMLVVLVLLGLLTSLVGPRLSGSLKRAERVYELDLLSQNLAFVGRVARYRGQHLMIGHLPDTQWKDQPPVDLPSGWSAVFSPALEVGANGVCSESHVVVRHEGEEASQARLTVLPLTCEVRQDGGI